MNLRHLRILRASSRDGITIASEAARLGDEGWMLSGAAAQLCAAALEEPCTLALHTRGRLATDEEIALVRHALRTSRLAFVDVGLDLARIDMHIAPSPATHSPDELVLLRRRSNPAHFCRGERCPGLSWPTEVLAHPSSCLTSPSSWPGAAAEAPGAACVRCGSTAGAPCPRCGEDPSLVDEDPVDDPADPVDQLRCLAEVADVGRLVGVTPSPALDDDGCVLVGASLASTFHESFERFALGRREYAAIGLLASVLLDGGGE